MAEESVIKSFRIRKLGYKSYHDGFVFISYSRIKGFGLEYDPVLKQLLIELSVKDEGIIQLSNHLGSEAYKLFLRRWNLFLKNDEYFFDLAEFSRIEQFNK
jgi:uncharacterized membrane protein YobD (UPF0266 family)